MANTLTGLIPSLYQALDVTSRELVGLIPSVAKNSAAERAAVNENVTIPVAPTANVSDITPAMTTPNPTDQTIGTTQITITKARAAEFGYVGEEQLGLDNGPGHLSVQAQQIAQALRSLNNEVETDLATLRTTFSRAFGTAGTTPFASNLTDTANIHKLLVDNGAPTNDKQLVFDTTAGASLRTLTQLTKANEAADQSLLRQGELLNVHGMSLRESAQIATHTKGTGTSYQSNNASGYAVGATSIAVDVGSGTVVAGDVVTFAGDSNKYLVTTGITAPGTLVLAAPGLREALADNVAMTIGADYSANMAFDRNAIQLVTRAPALPKEGDSALDRMVITDPFSGLAYELSVYGGYRKVRYEIALAWGYANIKPEHTVILLG